MAQRVRCCYGGSGAEGWLRKYLSARTATRSMLPGMRVLFADFPIMRGTDATWFATVGTDGGAHQPCSVAVRRLTSSPSDAQRSPCWSGGNGEAGGEGTLLSLEARPPNPAFDDHGEDSPKFPVLRRLPIVPGTAM